jgi:hypothetical protein
LARLTTAELKEVAQRARMLSASNPYRLFREHRRRRWEERFIAKVRSYFEEYTRG